MRPRYVLASLAASLCLVAAGCGDDPAPGSGSSDTGGSVDAGGAGDTAGAVDTGGGSDPGAADPGLADPGPADAGAIDAGVDVGPPAPPEKICAGVRGNGELIFAHFSALARIHEHYGLLWGIAGGSSASITSFVTESMYLHPAVTSCEGQACTDHEAGARVALMLKSLQGYAEIIGQTEEAVAFAQLAPILQAALDLNIDVLFADGKLTEAKDALITLFTSDELGALINPEVLDLLTGSPDPLFHAKDLWAGLTGFGNFSVESDRILIRPGVLNFQALARKLGRIANFYAAYGPADVFAFTSWLDACAERSRGLTWAAAAALDAGAGGTCGEFFATVASGYRDNLLLAEDSFTSRVDDPIGQGLHALISTSVLTGAAVTDYLLARSDYLQAIEGVAFAANFDDIRFGYWGDADDLAAAGANPAGYDDLKTTKFLSLGPATWETALSMSPAEPGLSRAIEIDSTAISAGGWSDLHPTLVLRNLGCDKVIYVTRQGGESGFAQGVAALLGMDAAGQAALYDLDVDSAYRRSLEASDGVWCTDWNAFSGLALAEISADAYDAPFETDDPWFATQAPDAYGGVTATTGLPGCTPGVAPAP